ncbi:MAG: TAXI family TRAP transporter solute-binding subunit [Vibrionaceae bacterium]
MPALRHLFVVFALFFIQPLSAQQQLMLIGAASEQGIYYPVAGALCRLVNKQFFINDLYCSAVATNGSMDNIKALQKNEVQFAIVQSNVQNSAYHAEGEFSKQGAFSQLRSLFSLHPEYFTILAKKNNSINTFTDIKERKINFGIEGSGDRQILESLLPLANLQLSDFTKVFELSSADQAKALCNNTIDATMSVIGHPNKNTQEAIEKCGAQLVGIDKKIIKKLLKQNSAYQLGEIPANIYANVPQSVDTLALYATVVTTAAIPDDVAYNFTKAVFEQLARLKKSHPALQNLSAKNMVAIAQSAPLHPGAERYFQEAGLLDIKPNR